MDIVFGKKWFKTHQRKLLWLLNTPIIRHWFRWCLRIRKNDCSVYEEITEITPSSFSWGDEIVFTKNGTELKRTTDFRTHDKYAKRLYFAFKPFWYALHALDWAMLDRVDALTKLSFGFSTLTAYPDSGTGGPTGDSSFRRTSGFESFATMRAGAGTELFEPSNQLYAAIQVATYPLFQAFARAIMTFDASALTSGATISAAEIDLYGTDKANPSGNASSFDIVAVTPSANYNFATSDYNIGNYGTTSFSNKAYASFNATASQYTACTLDANGIANISKTSISKFGVLHHWDFANSFGGDTSNSHYDRYGWYSADQSGTSNDPKLVVTYTITTTYTVTISALARIKLSGNDKTVSAKARMKVLGNNKTVSAKGRIKIIDITKTISAQARIVFTYTKTVSALARIKMTVDKTVSAKASIFNTVVQTISAKSRMKIVGNNKTINAKARIVFTETKTVSAKASIFNTVNRTISAKGRIKILGNDKTVSAKASVLNTVVHTLSALGRIKNTLTKTISAKAFINSTPIGVIVGLNRDTGIITGTRLTR